MFEFKDAIKGGGGGGGGGGGAVAYVSYAVGSFFFPVLQGTRTTVLRH